MKIAMSRRRGFVALIAVALLALGACMSPRGSAHVGLVNDSLAPCPESPNCVCSAVARSEGHAIDALPLAGAGATAIAELTQLIESRPRTRVVTSDGIYLHAEFKSLIFRFVDDVELLIDTEADVIHVRSASRVGHSDLGANRARVEELRAAWLAR